MLDLGDPRWNSLQTAYGSADDIPQLLVELSDLPPRDETSSEPYFSLWSALCHQGDVYTASYAAVPHIVRCIESAPTLAPWTLFLMVGCIEVARCQGRGPSLPEELASGYHLALARIPAALAESSKIPWDREYCGAAMCALAAAKGQWRLALHAIDGGDVPIPE